MSGYEWLYYFGGIFIGISCGFFIGYQFRIDEEKR